MEPKYGQEARQYRETRTPWKPFKLVLSLPQELKTERLEAAVIATDIEVAKIMNRVKLEK